MNRLLQLIVSLIAAASALAQDMATEIKATEAAPGVYMLEGANGFSSNMGLLVGDEHVVLIDDGMAPITADLIATVDELSGSSIDFIVNTHVHGDHVGSNATLAENGAVIFAHDNIRKRLVEAPDPAGGTAGLPVVSMSPKHTQTVMRSFTFAAQTSSSPAICISITCFRLSISTAGVE